MSSHVQISAQSSMERDGEQSRPSRRELQTMNGSLGITLRDIQRLTRWGRVAFAARCARRAKQVLERLGMDAGDPSMRICDDALKLAEDSAALALPQDKLDQAMMGLSKLAVSAVTPPEGLPALAHHQVPDEMNLIVYNVAHAAFAATRAAQFDSLESVLDAVDHALEAANIAGFRETARCVRLDYDGIYQATVLSGWTDASPVTSAPFAAA
jgi:hypothetical protein